MNEIALTKEQKISKAMKDLRNWCRCQLAMFDITQEQVAQIAGTTQQNVSGALRGKQRITFEMFTAIVWLTNPDANEIAKLFKEI